MKATGVPIDAVGVPSHLKADLPAPVKELQNSVHAMAKMNLQGVCDGDGRGGSQVPGTVHERDAVVAKVYLDTLR